MHIVIVTVDKPYFKSSKWNAVKGEPVFTSGKTATTRVLQLRAAHPKKEFGYLIVRKPQ